MFSLATYCLSALLHVAPGSTPAAPPPVLDEAAVAGPTEAEINEWIALVDASALGDEQKKALRDIYTAALGFVQTWQKSKDRTGQLDLLREDAPRKLAEEILPALARPAPPLPDPDPSASLAQWELQLNQAKAARDAADKAVADLEEEKRRRAENRARNPAETQAATTRLAEVERELEGLAQTTDPLDPQFARRQRLLAERRALKQRLAELKAEITSYDARTELFNRRVELAAKQKKEAADLVDHWTRLVNERRAREAEIEADRARVAQTIAERLGLPALKDVTARNLELAKLRAGDDGLPKRIEKATARLAELQRELESLKARFDQDKRRVETVGLSDALGQYLHSSRRLLLGSNTVAAHREEIRRREELLKEIVLDQIELDTDEQALGDVEDRVRQVLEDPALELDPARRQVVAESLTRAYGDLAQNLELVRKDYEDYLAALNELDVVEKEIVRLAGEYAEYLNEHVLWIRSSTPLSLDSLADAGGGIAWLMDPRKARRLGLSMRRDFLGRLPVYALLLVALLGLHTVRRRLARRRSEAPAEDAGREVRSPIAPVVLASLEALVRAAPAPVVLGFAAWRLDTATVGAQVDEYAAGIAAGLRAVAMLLFFLGVLREVSRKGGLAERILGWPTRSLRALRLAARSFAGIGAPLLFAYGCFSPERPYGDSLGRMAFIALLIMGALFTWRLRGAFEGVLSSLRGTGRGTGAWSAVYMLTGFWLPLAFAALSAWGYHFTTVQLADSLLATGWLLLLLVFAFTVFDQWFQYHRRLIALERLRKRREELLAQTAQDRDSRSDALAAVPAEPDEVDLRKANEQTRRMLRNVAVILFVFGLWGIWHDVLPALRVLEKVTLWEIERAGEPVAITLVNLLQCVAVVALTAIISANVTGFLELVVLNRLPLEAGTRYAVVTLVRYGIGFAGVALAFGAIGLRWSDLQWLVAALMVGLGFGLQEIFGNLVSGLILLLERPVRVGDTVTVGNTSGVVTRIRMRATTVADWDRKELVIPNKTFITSDIVNWSLTDAITRVVLPVGVAYGSDLKRVEELLLAAARSQKDVLADPPPSVVFQGFGDSSLNFDLRVFVPSVDRIIPVRHAVNRAIDALFRKNGIEIPFPQRDVHLHIEAKDGILHALPAASSAGESAKAQGGGGESR